MVTIILLFATYLYFKWKDISYKNNDSLQKANQINLNSQLSELNTQRKLISNYLLLYSAAIVVSGMFFWQDTHDGLTLLFKSTAPFNFLIYSIGFYFMITAAKQKFKLGILARQADGIAL